MSLTDLTRNSYQNGFAAQKWVNMCKLYISKNLLNTHPQDIEAELSNSVLLLFRDFPGDTILQAYLKHAVQGGTLSLRTYITTFLSAAGSLQDARTLDMLCRVALDCHYSSGVPAMGSIIPYGEPPTVVLSMIQNAMVLLRTAYIIPSSQFHHLTASASELLVLLLSCVGDVSQVSTAQAMSCFMDANDMAGNPHLSPAVRQELDTFLLSLGLVLGDEARATREAQMMHTLQLSLGKGDFVGGTSGTDIITCSLLLQSLMFRRASDFGAGDGSHAVVLLIALVRWASWTPETFYAQLLLSAVTCVAKDVTAGASLRTSPLWRAFVIGRLPHLLSTFEKTVELDGTSETDWRRAMHASLSSLSQHHELLAACDNVYQNGTDPSPHNVHPFMTEFIYQLLSLGLVEKGLISVISSNYPIDFHPRMQAEAQEHGCDLETYLESKLATDANQEDVTNLLERAWRDSCCHAVLAELVRKRFMTFAPSGDLESLGHLCKLLHTHETLMEILTLHIRLCELIPHAMAALEDYDFETVGDPQAAASQLGDVVLFLQSALGRFNLWSNEFILGDRRLSTQLLASASSVHRVEDLKGDDLTTFGAWNKALFDSGSEGIEDSLLRATRPRTLLKIAATLVCNAISLCHERKMDRELLNNGISYFCGPLLNWTLAGVVKGLLNEVQHKNAATTTTVHLEVLHILLESTSCPQPIIRLSSAAILRLFPERKQYGTFDSTTIFTIARKALKLPSEGIDPSVSLSGTDGLYVVRNTIRDAFGSARAGKAPSLDVDRCLLFTMPAKFLSSLWSELTVASSMGELETGRRIVTHILSLPRSSRSPPLLPIFLHLVLPNLVIQADHLAPAEQALAVELLVAIIPSALTAALYIEWALMSVFKEQRLILGQSALAMARSLSMNLRNKPNSPTSTLVMQRLAAISTFTSNFPTFTTDV